MNHWHGIMSKKTTKATQVCLLLELIDNQVGMGSYQPMKGCTVYSISQLSQVNTWSSIQSLRETWKETLLETQGILRFLFTLYYLCTHARCYAIVVRNPLKGSCGISPVSDAYRGRQYIQAEVSNCLRQSSWTEFHRIRLIRYSQNYLNETDIDNFNKFFSEDSEGEIHTFKHSNGRGFKPKLPHVRRYWTGLYPCFSSKFFFEVPAMWWYVSQIWWPSTIHPNVMKFMKSL